MNGRFPFSIEYEACLNGGTRRLVAGRDFRFDIEQVNRFCNVELSTRELSTRQIDFLRIAASVYFVDRLVRRYGRSRSIRVRVPVRQHEFWTSAEVAGTVRDTLEFLSGGDDWELCFTVDRSSIERSQALLSSMEDNLVCLYSGGLDSAAGLASRLSCNKIRRVTPITVWHQADQKRLVESQYEELKSFPCEIVPLFVKTAMIWRDRAQKRRQESTQRCRSFLFATVAAVVAGACGQDSVEALESGVGAINFPLTRGMIGWKATRGSHPTFLRLMSRLASLVSDQQIDFDLPFADDTKGEMVKRLGELRLPSLALKSVSCIAYPLRRKRAAQCGSCAACLFRRQAMFAAGISEPEQSYRDDIFDPTQEARLAAEGKLTLLKAFAMLAARLPSSQRENRFVDGDLHHLVSTQIVAGGEVPPALVNLFGRYALQWRALGKEALRRELAWGRWFAGEFREVHKVNGVTNAA